MCSSDLITSLLIALSNQISSHNSNRDKSIALHKTFPNQKISDQQQVPSPNKYNCYKLVDNTSKYPSLLTCGKFLSRTKLLEGNNLDLPIRDVREAVNPLSKFKRMSRPCSFIKDKRFKKNSQATSDTQLDLAPGMYEVHKSTLNLKASVSFGTSKRCDISRLPGSAGCWKGPGPGKYEVRDRDRCGNSTLDLRGCKM